MLLSDGSTWTSIATFSGKTYTNGDYTSITFPTSPIYTYFRLVVTKLASTGHSALNISEIRYTEVVDGIDIRLTNIGTGYTALPEIIIIDNDTGDQEDLSSFFDSVALKMKFVLPQIITSGTSGYGYTFEDDSSATTPIILTNFLNGVMGLTSMPMTLSSRKWFGTLPVIRGKLLIRPPGNSHPGCHIAGVIWLKPLPNRPSTPLCSIMMPTTTASIELSGPTR